MKHVRIHTLLNDSAAGKQHAKQVEERDHAYLLAVRREIDARDKAEERALAKDFETAREDKGIVAATATLSGLVETAIDIFTPDDKPTLAF